MGVFPSGQWGQTVNLLLFSFGGSNPPAPTKNSSVVMTLEFLFYLEVCKASQGGIRTAAALSQKTAQKQPSGLFLAALLATSTRAHQTRKIRTCFRLEKGSDFSFSSGTIAIRIFDLLATTANCISQICCLNVALIS